MQRILYNLMLLGLAGLMPAQTATQNYIKKTMPISPVSNEVNLGILGSAFKIESINYIDGLGRPVQDVLVKASPANFDLVQPMVYDQYGRMSKSYLPYADASNDGSFKTNAITNQLNFYTTGSAVAKTSTPFSNCYFDGSPLNMVRETTAPDTDWQLGNGHTTKVEQSFNTLQGDAILLWVLQSNGDYYSDGYNYADNTLAVTKVTDPNGNYSYMYKDKQGKTICTKQFLEMRTVGSNQVPYYLTTYLVYDDFGQLVLVIPPKAMDLMDASANYSVNALAQDLVFKYVYDERHRLIEKKVPGTGWSYIVYNPLNQPVLFQDANLRLQNKWGFVKYDVLGRPILSGLFNATGLAGYQTRALAQAKLNSSMAATGESRVLQNASNPFGYTHVTLPDTNLDILTVNHYDDYDFDNNGTADYSFNATPVPCLIFNTTTTQGVNTGIQGTISNIIIVGNNISDIRKSSKDVTLIKALDECDKSYTSLRQFLDNAFALSQSLLQAQSNDALNNLKSLLTSNISKALENLQNQISICKEIDKDGVFKNQISTMSTMAARSTESINSAAAGVNILLTGCQPYYNTPTSRTRGYLTGSRVKVLDAPNLVQWEVSTVFYDEEGQAIQAQSNDHLGGTDLVNMVYDFTGNLIHTQQVHSLASQAPIEVLNHMNFDKMGRLQRVDQKNNADVPVVLSSYAYNELSQLIDKKVHSIDNGSNFLQSMDYRYHIQGWLRSINNIDLASDMAANPLNGTNDDSNDLWGMELNYNSTTAGINGAKQYTGNVAEKKWRSITDNIKRGYGYTYDKADRLTNATYKEGTTGTWGAGANGRSFDETLSYDANGNILSLARTGCQSSGTSFGLIDNLTYKYNGNFLAAVNDASPTQGYLADFKDNGSTAASGEYTYDGNGNLTANANKKITSITYNHLNLPTQINFVGGNKIEYTYDAGGVRLRKKVTNGTNLLTKNYCGAYEYNNNGLELMHTGEGRCVPTNATGTLSFRYEYHYADNTGNITLAFSDLDNNGSIATNEVIQESSYYAFGMRMEGLATPQIGVEHKYKFGGKELQDELGLNELDFGARFYDPAIARWGCIDPMADMAPNWTPFRFCFNNPLTVTDPTGMNEVSDQVGGGADYNSNDNLKKLWDKIRDWFGDTFQDKRYNVGNPEEKKTTVKAPGDTEFDGEEAGDLLSKASEKEQNSAQNFINDGASSAFSIASAAGSYTGTPVQTQTAQSGGDGKDYSLGKNGVGLNIGGGIGVMAQSVEFNIGAFVNSNGFGQMYFSYGYFNQKAPLYVNAGASVQALYIHTQAPKIDLSGDGHTGGLGFKAAGFSYGYSHNDKGQRTDIYGAGAGLGIKYSGGFTNTKTFTTLFINWWPSMNFHLP